MRMRLMLLLSLAMNFVLAAALFYLYHRPEEFKPSVPARPASTVSVTNIAKPRVLVRKQFFSWNEIESEDFPTYIANLRSIDCPEPTIRDLIVAEVNQLYAQKQAKEIISTDHQWWRSDPDLDTIQAAMDHHRLLETERRELLTRLLGPGWETAANANLDLPAGPSLGGPVLGELPPETKLTVLEIAAKAEQRQKEYVATQIQTGQAADSAELAQLRQQTRQELAKVLTPTQLEEYLLRYSHTAAAMREELRGFEATPSEFREVFRIRDPIEQQIELYYSASNPEAVTKRQELEQQQNAAIKQVLGSERFQLYQVLQDPIFREAQETAEQMGAPPEKAIPIYQVNQLTMSAQQRIQNDPTLTELEREGALQLVQEEQQKSILQILGNPPTAVAPVKPNPYPVETNSVYPPLPPQEPISSP